MSVRFFYVDESYDDKRFCLSAIGLRHADWRNCFIQIKQHRSILKQDHGIFVSKEIHAHELVGGRGRISDRVIGKYDRSQIFEGLLTLVAKLPNVMVINICLEVAGRSNPQLDAWDRLMNRIERTLLEMENRELPLRRRLVEEASRHLSPTDARELSIRLNSYCSRAVIVADEGREVEITRTLRKMSVFNPIPSRIGSWSDGKPTKNIPIEHIIEDPVFRESHRSYLVQLADCVAFALLKRESPPTPNVKRYSIHKMFDKCLSGVCLRTASRKDPLGIVRK